MTWCFGTILTAYIISSKYQNEKQTVDTIDQNVKYKYEFFDKNELIINNIYNNTTTVQTKHWWNMLAVIVKKPNSLTVCVFLAFL